MRIISYKMIRQFAAVHSAAEGPLNTWYNVVEDCQWNSHADLKLIFPSADFVRNERYVFNIAGNNYRVIAAVNFKAKIVYIKFIGTHSEYDKVDAATISRLDL